MDLNDKDIEENPPKIDEWQLTSIFNIVLEDWMYNFGVNLEASNYALLFDRIKYLATKSLPLKFFIPGFPCKSSNTERKVLSHLPDMSEFLAIRSLLSTIRKLETVYSNGVKIVILSDYHTFDQYIGVGEEAYQEYHRELKKMINEAGITDEIELISLSSFPEFKATPGPEISRKLHAEYGGAEVLETFDEAIEKDPVMLNKYKQLKKFMQADQSHNLPGSPRGVSTRNFIKWIARGMLAQGVALDNFLQRQTTLVDYVRLSIHHHLPSSGKFAIDMFKGQVCDGGILRTPWHHTALFESLTGDFVIDQKASVEERDVDDSCLVKVTLDERPWFLLRLYVRKEALLARGSMPNFTASMVRGSCGMIIECTDEDVESSFLHADCLTSLIKEFGLIVLRGFKKFETEEKMLEFYNSRAENGILNWSFGPVHKVTPKENMAGYVNSYEGIPIHFDLVAPPKYMEISQDTHSYSDFICREFLLYCKMIDSVDEDGATTFVDARGAVLALTGSKMKEWQGTTLSYETKLKLESNKELYFGGTRNTYEYPLVLQCPWTGHNVLRWWESWTEKDHPASSQHNWSVVKSTPEAVERSPEEVEEEVKKLALDERFFFAHSYQEGDQAYVNNYTVLHGRNGFSNGRELWRVQAVPPSDNTPDYYANNRFMK